MLEFIGATKEDLLLYPDSDGKPIAESTLQYEWITKIKSNLDVLFAKRKDVFVAADLFWYAVEGKPRVRLAPDVLVAFGRPKGHRYSYMQWKEEGIPPHIVIEVHGPGSRFEEMRKKFRFFDRHGVEEYYLYDPETFELNGWRREAGALVVIPTMAGWKSKRLGVRFDVSSGKLVLRHPNGERFLSMLERHMLHKEAQELATSATGVALPD